jgi:CubicO group peptidase (beta-lactamase class C family)
VEDRAGESWVEEGWGKVADAFRANFEGSTGELGAACGVYADGRPVVDLWGGVANRRTNRPWSRDTMVMVASTTKGATAICAHLLVQRGDLELDAPVAAYWPEFGQAGKAELPVRWVLSHQAGLPLFDAQLTLEEACAWDPVIRALEVQAPLWEPGTEHLYHPQTFGFLVGELVRRVSGRSLGTFFHDEVAVPLGLDSWIGVPQAQLGRVARIDYAAPFTIEELTAGMIELTGLDETTVTRWIATSFGPDSVGARASVLGGALDLASDFLNEAPYLTAEFPGANMVTDARSLARMYAATVSDVEGVRLLEPATVETMSTVQTDRTRMHGLPPDLDVPADRSFNMALGFWRQPEAQVLPMLGPASFGHPGSGGSIGFADPETRVGFGYVPNLWSFNMAEPRARNLARAVAACVGS